MEVLVEGYLNRETEFTHGLTGDCGPNALHVLASWSDNTYISTYTIYQHMIAHVPPLCGTNGESTGSGLRTAALTAGYTVTNYFGYAGDVWAGWQTFIMAELDAGRPVLIELSYGQAIVDWITSKGEDATNLRYHYITLVGYNTGGTSTRPEAAGKTLPNGIWAADGDSYDSGDVLQFIPLTVLNSAHPCMALSIARRVALPPPTGVPMVPTGWHDDGTTLTAPNGKSVVHGFRTYILNKVWPSTYMPIDGEYATATGSRQDFGFATAWTASSNSIAEVAPTDFADQLATLHAQFDTLNQKLADANKANATLQSELTAAQAQLGTVQSELASANQKVVDLTSQLSTANQQVTLLTTKLSNDDSQLSTDNAQITDLTNQLTAANAEIATLKAQPLPPDAQAAVIFVKAMLAAQAAFGH